MILCAGHGTRLRPLTDELPKPLVPIGDRSLLAHVASSLRVAGFEHLVLNAHHLAARTLHAAGELGLVGVFEPSILGTAGGVAHAREALGAGDLIVVNGDILADLDFATLVRCHVTRGPFATLAVAQPKPAGEGTLGLDAEGRVVRLRGERFGDEVRSADFVGAQAISTRARANLPREGCLVGDLYLPALRRGVELFACVAAERFWDIGTPAAYLACNLDWLERRGARSFVAGTVAPEVELDRAIIAAGATVRGEGLLRDVVVWPGATVVAPLHQAVASPHHLVRVENL